MKSRKRLADLRHQEEIGNLKNKISDTEQMLKEERKTRMRLRLEAESKLQQIAAMEESIAREEMRHRQEKQKMIDLTIEMENARKKRLKELQDKEKNMKYEISSYDLIERENKMLQQRLKALSATYYNDLVIQEEEREARKQQNFDTRMMMDLVLRKTIKALDKDYKEKAVTKMDNEACNAKFENKALYSDILTREDISGQLIVKEQTSYEQLRRLRIEQEVMDATASIQEQKVIQMNNITEKQQRAIDELTLFIEELKMEFENLQDLWSYKIDRSEKLCNLDSELQSVVMRHKEQRNAVINFTQRLVRDGLTLSAKEREQRSLQIVAGLTDDTLLSESSPTKSNEMFPDGGDGGDGNEIDWEERAVDGDDGDEELLSNDLHQLLQIKNKNSKDSKNSSNNNMASKSSHQTNNLIIEMKPETSSINNMDLIWCSKYENSGLRISGTLKKRLQDKYRRK